MWIQFNLNNNIRVELTDFGKRLYRNSPYTGSGEFTLDGKLVMQCWRFMLIFGEHIQSGSFAAISNYIVELEQQQ